MLEFLWCLVGLALGVVAWFGKPSGRAALGLLAAEGVAFLFLYTGG